MQGKRRDAYSPALHGTRPIFMHDFSALAWRLLWWLICEMDEECEVLGGWRSRAAEAMRADRSSVVACSEMLYQAGLIDTRPGLRRVKVLVSSITR